MDLQATHLVRRPELEQLLYYLNEGSSQGVLLLGAGGTGKTAMLNMIREQLSSDARAVFLIDLRGMAESGELGAQALDAIAKSSLRGASDIRRTLRTSAGAPPLREAAVLLRHAGERMPSPVLLLDALDASANISRVAAGIEELSSELDGWKFVISSRTAATREIRRFSRFAVIQLAGLQDNDAIALVRSYAPDLSDIDVMQIVRAAEGSPLYLRLIIQEIERSGSVNAITESFDPTLRLEDLIERLVANAARESSSPAKLIELLEDLALAGGRDTIASLAEKSQITESDVRRLLGGQPAISLVALDDSAGTAALLHVAVTEFIRSRGILAPRFRLTDLEFGAEEAERDDLLDESFVRRRGMETILAQRRSLIVGDRGSGKSAIFRRLATNSPHIDDHGSTEILPISNTGDRLHRVVDKDTWLDADALRAAWLVVVASLVASSVTESAPKSLRRDAANLRIAFESVSEPASPVTRTLRKAFGFLGGTTLNLAVGPVNLQAQLPSGGGGRSGSVSIDVEKFLHEVDNYQRTSARRLVIMFDRIDETFKYDRPRQEAVVQALLQAEAHVSLLGYIGLVIFLRTDLFELYDIQEKNKLVSRTLTLDCSEEEWLQVISRRVLANDPFHRLAKRFSAADGSLNTRSALELLFPSQVENQPIDRWLIDSLRNGNGDVSPRHAILLLYLTRDASARLDEEISALPLFSADEVGKAMTKLSELSFSEVVNDFKIASSFVLNCRAAKRESFALRDVESLFDAAEGKLSEQVRLLERLGFLERVVEEGGPSVTSMFRIPRLYTRCWDHA